jgi:hypothetical protein
MGKSRWLQYFGLGTALLGLALAPACSRRENLEADGGNSPSREQQVPFHQAAADASGSGTEDDHASPRPKGESDLPFKASASLTLPAGTLLTVRLETPISTAEPDASRTFAAILEAPVTVDGTRVLPRGAAAKGRLECAHNSGLNPGAGYVCLTLDSIVVGGKTIPLQTSSLFAKGMAEPPAESAGAQTTPTQVPPAVRINKGHRLTFRLRRDVLLGASVGEDASDDIPSGSK